MPSEASLREDLRVLSEAGFDGLFTMTCRGACADAARLAHELGFGLVVLGVYSPGDKAEVEQAKRAAPYADAYCLGHERLGEDYDRETLRQLMSTFRRETHKPVTTTAVLADYANDPQLYMEWSDFLCPDVHASWHYGQPAQEAWEETEQMGLHAATLATPYPGKPVLLKMVSYPSAGAEGLSPTSQLEFYRRATGAMQHSVRFPRGVTPVFLGAFDAPWKDAAHGWPESERHTGLFTADRQPKPAALEIPWPMLHRSKAPVSLRR
jgi:hypothetical protein